MSTCPACHQEVPGDARFCPHCGEPLAATPRICPQCGTENEAANRYCKSCGAILIVETAGKSRGTWWNNPYLVIMLLGIIAMGVATYYNFKKGPLGGAAVTATAAAPPTEQSVNAPAGENEALPFTPEELEAHIQALKDKIHQEPDNVKNYVDLGNLLFDAGRFTDAIPYYQKALELDPKQPEVIVDMGVCYFQQEDYAKAKELFQKALDIDPNHVYALYNMGIVDIRMGDVEGLINAWTKLIEIAPNSPQAQRAKQILDEAHQQVEQNKNQSQQTGGAD